MPRLTLLNLNHLFPILAFSKAFFEAGIGPDPIKEGSTPHVAQDTILARGFKFLFSDSLSLIKTTAAAPSLIPEEFPGVTVPSFLKDGFNLVKFFYSHSFLGCSSISNLDFNIIFF